MRSRATAFTQINLKNKSKMKLPKWITSAFETPDLPEWRYAIAPPRMPRYKNIQLLVDQSEQFENKGESELAEMTLQNLVKYIEKTKTT